MHTFVIPDPAATFMIQQTTKEAIMKQATEYPFLAVVAANGHIVMTLTNQRQSVLQQLLSALLAPSYYSDFGVFTVMLMFVSSVTIAATIPAFTHGTNTHFINSCTDGNSCIYFYEVDKTASYKTLKLWGFQDFILPCK